jgi:hypothetical protein
LAKAFDENIFWALCCALPLRAGSALPAAGVAAKSFATISLLLPPEQLAKAPIQKTSTQKIFSDTYS